MKINRLVKEVLSWVLTFFVAFVIVWGVQKVFIQPFVVEGHSMDYTLAEGERLFMLKLAKIERFDVVVIEAPNNPEKMYIKRVIGMPGDTIEMQNDQLILNGQALEEPYLAQKQSEFTGNFTNDFTLEQVAGAAVVPEGQVFVMGDNRQNSLDGRSFGFVSLDSIIGEANLIHWPLNKIGLLDQYNLNEDGTAIVKK